MKKDAKFYLKLFTSTLYLSSFTFGGGFVIIPLMKKKFVDEYKWIEEKEMLDLAAIAQSAPGAIAVNAAIIVGYRLAGVLGAIITIIGTVLPPLIILSIISVAYTAFRDSLIVKYILRGMQAGVAAVIIDVVISMASSLFKEKKLLPIMIMIGAFIATFILNINVIIIILTSGIMGAISIYYSKHVKKVGDLK
ncbi:chromate transporter [Clostridium estertheticum]|uniref:chromate transporter n=1 Tax=Clostridium estertheticum TaxID=238834 RepID=UPI001CF4669D|nr:chromate transporter [Clostridium estertheticum]MCB2305111.1 chromate transporter [Clostridium estertheticum]MCB2343619.1 chromate transporter [Clostridium estertheticum]MCB2348539.1 chromate transporter [Clostridium estertheticum]WAG47483.1 chromate transporter [Clostridium estertheticum]